MNILKKIVGSRNDRILKNYHKTLREINLLSEDMKALSDGDFPDIETITNSRPSAFPEFLMDWVTRQVEEFSNGLTSFPGITIILPSFDGVFEFGDNDASDLDPVFSVKTQAIGQKI